MLDGSDLFSANLDVIPRGEHPEAIAKLDFRNRSDATALEWVERIKGLTIARLRLAVSRRDRMKDSDRLRGWHGFQHSDIFPSADLMFRGNHTGSMNDGLAEVADGVSNRPLSEAWGNFLWYVRRHRPRRR